MLISLKRHADSPADRSVRADGVVLWEGPPTRDRVSTLCAAPCRAPQGRTDTARRGCVTTRVRGLLVQPTPELGLLTRNSDRVRAALLGVGRRLLLGVAEVPAMVRHPVPRRLRGASGPTGARDWHRLDAVPRGVGWRPGDRDRRAGRVNRVDGAPLGPVVHDGPPGLVGGPVAPAVVVALVGGSYDSRRASRVQISHEL
jgi:hypothetical protein